MASAPNPNGLRVVTGGQAGTLDVQYVLIQCYNAPFTLTPTIPAVTDPPGVPANYEFISDPNDGFAQVIAVIQDFAEIYYIGWPYGDAGSSDLLQVVVGINPNSARGLDSETYTFPTATGRWTDLEDALNNAISEGSAEAWFAMPGQGWNWSYDN